jgi:hypothetical protein
MNEKILGWNLIIPTDLFFNKALYYVMLHFYLQQPGIKKMFLLCNIPGKVPLFFLYKQDIMRVNCMQNITKYDILLRNVASVLKYKYHLCVCFIVVLVMERCPFCIFVLFMGV